MTETIAVIGGAGFIGTRLCERLNDAGAEFLIVDKRCSETFPGRSVVADVRDVEALAAALPNGGTWFNLAAEHRDDVSPLSLYHDVNVQGARNICAIAASKKIKRIVFTSSVACYGNAPAGTGEDGKIAPFNEYGRTKFLAEEVFRSWQREDAEYRKLAIVRPTVVFGESNRGNVYNLLRQVAVGRFVMVGSGTNVKSMAYVGNLAAVLHMLIDREDGNLLVNYVDGPAMDMNTLIDTVRRELGLADRLGIRLPVGLGLLAGKLADAVSRITGRKFPISAIRVSKFVSDSHFSSSAGSLGFVPSFGLEEALRRTIRHEFIDGRKEGPLFFSE